MSLLPYTDDQGGVMGNGEETTTIVRLTNAGYRLMCARIRADMGKMNTLEMARFITDEFKVGYDTYQFDSDELEALFGDPTPEEIEAVGSSQFFED